jgi:DNA replication protein DnaC
VPERFIAPIPETEGDPWCATRRQLIQAANGRGSVVLIHGPRGKGKTQLVCDVAHSVRNRLRMMARYTTAADLFRSIRDSFGGEGKERALIEQMTAPLLLVIDEAHERGGTEFENRVLTEIVDKRYAAMRETFLVTNETVAQAEKSLGPSIWSRMIETGGLVEVNGRNYRVEGA